MNFIVKQTISLGNDDLLSIFCMKSDPSKMLFGAKGAVYIECTESSNADNNLQFRFADMHVVFATSAKTTIIMNGCKKFMGRKPHKLNFFTNLIHDSKLRSLEDRFVNLFVINNNVIIDQV